MNVESERWEPKSKKKNQVLGIAFSASNEDNGNITDSDQW